MANLKITELVELTTPIASDLFPVVDLVAGTTKKIPISIIRDTFVGTTSIAGTVKISVAPASAASPIAVGDNDGRIPTQGENDALAGSYGAPSSANKFVTASDANLTNNVKTTGDETIAGVKTFSSIPVLPASDPTSDNQAVRKSYVDGLVVKSTGNVLAGTYGGSDLTMYYKKIGKNYISLYAKGNGTQGYYFPMYPDSNTVNKICALLSKTLSSYEYQDYFFRDINGYLAQGVRSMQWNGSAWAQTDSASGVTEHPDRFLDLIITT